MAESELYLVTKERLTGIADAVRERTGGTDVIAFENLSTAIKEDIEDVTDETTAYTTKLAALETAMNELNTELDGKAAGGSAVETCTVTVISNYAAIQIWYFNGLETVNEDIVNVAESVIFTIVKNSPFLVIVATSGYSFETDALVLHDSSYDGRGALLTADNDVTLTATEEGMGIE